MKRYYINDAETTKEWFYEKLTLDNTKGVTEDGQPIAAGARIGFCDSEHVQDLGNRIECGWTYRIIYNPAGIDDSFAVKEEKECDI